MSIDRFIVRKLDSCKELHTRLNLVKLFQLRVDKAQSVEEIHFKKSVVIHK